MTGAAAVRVTTIVLLLGAGALAACDAQDRVAPPLTSLPRALSVQEQSLVNSGNGFAFRLLREVVAADTLPRNVFISPLSVSVALGMTLNGAAGETADSMRATLGFGGMSQHDINAGYRALIELLAGLDASVTWSLANSVWYRHSYSFKQSFFDTTTHYFGARIEGLDFASPTAAPTINQWVNDATHGRITEIAPDPLPFDAIMYLINAIYFKGSWTTQFDPRNTAPRPFQLAGGASISVPTMSHQDMPARASFGAGYTVAELPYARQAYAMTIVMPHAAAAIDSLARGLTQEQWQGWIDGLGSFTGPVLLPKFTFSYGLGLKPPLAALGMGVTYCEGGNPDFSNMTSAGACINDVQHKTFVLVDEVGTEAAAVTSVEMGPTSAPPAIVIDRPFIFAIRERLSGTIIFMGVVRDPSRTE